MIKMINLIFELYDLYHTVYEYIININNSIINKDFFISNTNLSIYINNQQIFNF